MGAPFDICGRRPRPALAPPALRKRGHSGLARRLVAVRCALDRGRRVTTCPHPMAVLRRDSADDHAVFEHVEVVLAADWRAFEAQRGHFGGGGGGGRGGLGGGGFGLVDNMVLVRLTWHDEVAMAVAGLQLRLASLAFSLV